MCPSQGGRGDNRSRNASPEANGDSLVSLKGVYWQYQAGWEVSSTPHTPLPSHTACGARMSPRGGRGDSKFQNASPEANADSLVSLKGVYWQYQAGWEVSSTPHTPLPSPSPRGAHLCTRGGRGDNRSCNASPEANCDSLVSLKGVYW